MNPKPRPSVKKKAAARAERQAARQQAQEARAAAREAREKAKREAAEAKAAAAAKAAEEAKAAAEEEALEKTETAVENEPSKAVPANSEASSEKAIPANAAREEAEMAQPAKRQDETPASVDSAQNEVQTPAAALEQTPTTEQLANEAAASSPSAANVQEAQDETPAPEKAMRRTAPKRAARKRKEPEFAEPLIMSTDSFPVIERDPETVNAPNPSHILENDKTTRMSPIKDNDPVVRPASLLDSSVIPKVTVNENDHQDPIAADVARFSAAASRAHRSFVPGNQVPEDPFSQVIPAATDPRNVNRKPVKRSRSTQIEIPRGNTSQFAAIEVPDNGFDTGLPNDYSPFFEPAEDAVGMKAAKGYKRKAGPLHIIAKVLGILIFLAALVAIIVAGTLTVKEYRPKDQISVSIENPSDVAIAKGHKTSVLTWDIGHASFDAEADSFFQGGTSVKADSEQNIKMNMEGINKVISKQNADIVFLQNVDVDSDRTFNVNESKIIAQNMEDSGYSSAYATDFNVLYVPYPFPMLGAIDSGIMTGNKYYAKDAERLSVYDSQTWPLGLITPKPCFLVERMPVADTTKQLVLVNTHLSAFDNESSRAQQASQIAQLIKREYDKGNYVIIGGDFSQTFSNVDASAYPQPKNDDSAMQYGTMDTEVFGDFAQAVMDASRPTCRSLSRPYDKDQTDFPFYVVDGFIVSANVSIDSCTTVKGGFKYSNHNPVRLEATLN